MHGLRQRRDVVVCYSVVASAINVALLRRAAAERRAASSCRDVVVGCSVAAVVALVALTVCFCRRRPRPRPSLSDPEHSDAGPVSQRGRLAAVQAPPPVPDLSPSTPDRCLLDPCLFTHINPPSTFFIFIFTHPRPLSTHPRSVVYLTQTSVYS